MSVRCSNIQTAGYGNRTAQGTTGDECHICGKQTLGLAGAIFVAVDHTCSEFVNDAEAIERGDRCSYYPVGSECVKKWRKAIGLDATRTRLRRAKNGIVAYGQTAA